MRSHTGRKTTKELGDSLKKAVKWQKPDLEAKKKKKKKCSTVKRSWDKVLEKVLGVFFLILAGLTALLCAPCDSGLTRSYSNKILPDGQLFGNLKKPIIGVCFKSKL